MNGILNILKPPGMTSFDVVAVVRKNLGGVKAGHAGTLDPMAAGVLPVFTGKALKVIEYAAGYDKKYTAEITFGIATDTYDSEGKVLSVKEVDLSLTDVQAVVEKYCGEILQTPPMYSAIKINGKKLYEIARAGGTAEIEPRKVMIRSINLRNFDGRKALIDVVCSKGTYIRSLCRDIGEELGCGAHMSFLVRTAVGDFLMEDALPINELAGLAAEGNAPFIPFEIVLTDFTVVHLNATGGEKFLNGIAISRNDFVSFASGKLHPGLAVVRSANKNGQILAIGEFIGTDGDELIKIKSGKLLIE